MHARSVHPHKLRKKFVSSGGHGGIHTFSHIQRNQSSYMFRCQCTCIRISFQPKPIMKYAECKSKYFHICIPIHILPYPTTRYNLNPQLNTHHIHMQACIHRRTKANSPRPHAHILWSCHSSTYLGVEAFDPYITIQVNGIHTIAHPMDDEIKTPMLVLKQPQVITGTLQISNTYLYSYQLLERVLEKQKLLF